MVVASPLLLFAKLWEASKLLKTDGTDRSEDLQKAELEHGLANIMCNDLAQV